MRTPVMAGNWKMFKNPAETTAFFEKFLPQVAGATHCEIVLCPPASNITAAVAATPGDRGEVGAQHV
ncbi:MAG: triose-phosphate isomerase [Acidobacteriota bacterium]